MEALNKMAGANGTRLIKTTAITGADLRSIYFREDSVLTVLSGIDKNGVAINYLTVGNRFGIVGIVTTEAMKAGDLLTLPQGYTITAITLTSGSALGY